jgi:hypothetical protein
MAEAQGEGGSAIEDETVGNGLQLRPQTLLGRGEDRELGSEHRGILRTTVASNPSRDRSIVYHRPLAPPPEKWPPEDPPEPEDDESLSELEDDEESWPADDPEELLEEPASSPACELTKTDRRRVLASGTSRGTTWLEELA